MAYRTLDFTIISAKDLNKVNLFGKMCVYALVYINGAANQDPKQKTPVDKEGDTNPTWNHPMEFTIDESAALHNRLTLVVKIKTEGMFGDKDVGEVNVPVKELLEGAFTGGKPLRFVTYQVRKPSGKPKGELSFSYKFVEKSVGTVEEPVMAYPAGKHNKVDELEEPVMAYPAVDYGPRPLFPQLYAVPPIGAAPRPYPPPTASAGDDSYPPVSTAGGNLYPPPAVTSGGDLYTPAEGAYYPPPPAGYPQPQTGYAYQQQPAYGGYYLAQTQGYGGYLSQTGYAYPPVQQPQKNNNRFGLGLGTGLLGGLLIGEMVSDAADCFDF